MVGLNNLRTSNIPLQINATTDKRPISALIYKKCLVPRVRFKTKTEFAGSWLSLHPPEN